MAKSGIETIAARALQEFLESKSAEIVSGMTSNGEAIVIPTVTKSAATPPTKRGPFIAVFVSGHGLEFESSNSLAIKGSTLMVSISLENILKSQVDDTMPYEVDMENHTNMGDRIIGRLVTAFKDDRVIRDTDTQFAFQIVPEDGMQKTNSGGPIWKKPSFYIEAISEITFSLRSACEQATF